MTLRRLDAGAIAALGVFACGAHAATFKTLASIAGSGDGSAPVAPLIDVGGELYGTTPASGPGGCGVVYRFDSATGTETVIYGFKGGADGCAPAGSLLNVGGALYGTTAQGGSAGDGTVFKIDPARGTEAVLHNFAGGSDGATPSAALINLKGTLYGTTSAGGSPGFGTVFAIDRKTGAESVVYAFAGGNDAAAPATPLLNVGGLLFGTTAGGGAGNAGTVFSVNPSTGAESVVYAFTGKADGGHPLAALIEAGGTLYGTAVSGGASNDGAVFSIDPASGAETAIFSFSSAATGLSPQSALTFVHGKLYGTAFGGGANYDGALYAVNPKSGKETLVYSFGGSGDVANPVAAVLSVDGALYGLGETGGALGAGGIFAVSLSSGDESLAYSFTGANNDEAAEGITRHGSELLAAVAQGGANSIGEVLSIGAGGSVDTLSSFGSGVGMYPSAAMLADGAVLYGTTKSGGTSGAGTIYRCDPSTGAITTVYSFSGGNDGGIPYASVIKYDGALYGTTVAGGTSGSGTVFKFDPKTGAESALYSFTGGNDGGFPYSGLTNVGGKLYGGTARGGTGYYGVLFSIDPKTGKETVQYNFTGGNDGGVPSAPLLNVGGTLYGTALYGGQDGLGVVFEFNPGTGNETVLHAFAGGTDGDAPDAALVMLGKSLYGSTSGIFGGSGTIFKINPTTGAEHVLYNFTGGADGGEPNTGLVPLGGRLYGVTGTGGTANLGTIFSLKP